MKLANDAGHVAYLPFCFLQERLLRHFCNTPMLLESRGSLIVRRLCVLLGAERVFREMAGILMEEANIEFAGAFLSTFRRRRRIAYFCVLQV